MKRKYLIAGNWKMNPAGNPLPLLREMKTRLLDMKGIELLIAPPFTALHQAVSIFKDTPVRIGAQNLYWEDSGAFTGEISASMIKETGASYVIIGHSERRQYFGETEETVNLRLKAALKEGLLPILCLGETAREREKGETMAVVRRQFQGALKGLTMEELSSLLIAYEPVWAIGSGKVARPEDAQEVHRFLRDLLKESFGGGFSEKVRILYGGSVKPDNAEGLFRQADIDGALVGGASLSAEAFAKIAAAAINL